MKIEHCDFLLQQPLQVALLFTNTFWINQNLSSPNQDHCTDISPSATTQTSLSGPQEQRLEHSILSLIFAWSSGSISRLCLIFKLLFIRPFQNASKTIPKALPWGKFHIEIQVIEKISHFPLGSKTQSLHPSPQISSRSWLKRKFWKCVYAVQQSMQQSPLICNMLSMQSVLPPCHPRLSLKWTYYDKFKRYMKADMTISTGLAVVKRTKYKRRRAFSLNFWMTSNLYQFAVPLHKFVNWFLA